VGKLQALLDEERHSFELKRQDKFAQLLGLPNTATAYEYLKSRDTGKIQQRRDFIHVPDLAVEKKARREAQAKVREEIKELQRKGVLLVNQKSEKSANKNFYESFVWAQNPEAPEVIASWRDSFGIDSSESAWKRFVGPAWQESEIGLSLGVAPAAMHFSCSGRLFAKVSGRRVEIWDLQKKTVLCERDFKGHVAALSFSVDEKWLFLVVSNNPKTELHRIALERGLSDQMIEDETLHFQRVVPHPAGELIAVIDNGGILLVFEIETLRIATQKWILDKTSLLLLGQFQGVAETMTADVIKHLGAREAELYRKDTERHFLPKDPIRVACFNENGDVLFCGTHKGLRGLQWKEVMDGAQMTSLNPTLSIDAEFAQHEANEPEILRHRLIYAVVFDGARQRVLYSGLEAKISFLNIEERRTGTLLRVPGGATLIDLALSGDRSALIATAHQFDVKLRKPEHFQIWNYRALCEAADIEY
jgi:hypothetical protein